MKPKNCGKRVVASVHASPVFMNLDATIDKTIGFIEEAGQKGIDLLVFPESFVPGYPYWTLCYPCLEIIDVISEYHDASIEVPGPEVSRVQNACKRAGVAVVLGISERLAGARTCFNSQVFVDADGTLLGVHRKVQPTYNERLVWGQGGGATMKVFDSKLGNVGGLCCWEHTMNLARQDLIHQNEQIHGASWPGGWPSVEHPLGQMSNSIIESVIKTHAITGQCFVVSAGNPVDQATIDWMTARLGPQKLATAGGGFSAIIHPYTNYVAGPHTGAEEKLLSAEIDLDDLKKIKVLVEGVGHYSRPEVFRLHVDHRPLWRDEGVQPVPPEPCPKPECDPNATTSTA